MNWRTEHTVKRLAPKIGAVAVMLLALLSAYLFLYEAPYSGLITEWGDPLVIAHRGFGNLAPDNSMAAVKIAIESEVDGVDVDGHLTADGELIIFHDMRVDRLTDGSGLVRDKTLDELKALDLGSKFSSDFAGERIATFEEMLTQIDGRKVFMVELKVTSLKDTGIERKAVGLIQKHAAHDKVFITAFNPVVLYRIKRLDPNVRTVFAFMDTNWNEDIRREMPPEDITDLPWFVRKPFTRRLIRKIVRPDILSVNHKVAETTIDALLAKGYPIFLWAPDSDEDLQWSFEKRPFGIITNEPLRALERSGR